MLSTVQNRMKIPSVIFCRKDAALLDPVINRERVGQIANVFQLPHLAFVELLYDREELRLVHVAHLKGLRHGDLANVWPQTILEISSSHLNPRRTFSLNI